MYCLCINVYCHRVTTQLQLINIISFVIESFIHPTDAQLNCSKSVKIYMRGVLACFGLSQPSSGSYCMRFAKVISINTQLKYIVHRISSV